MPCNLPPMSSCDWLASKMVPLAALQSSPFPSSPAISPWRSGLEVVADFAPQALGDAVPLPSH